MLLMRGLGVVDMAIQYFPAISLVELIRRDQGRANFVGAAVLREHIQRLQPEERYWAVLEQTPPKKSEREKLLAAEAVM